MSSIIEESFIDLDTTTDNKTTLSFENSMVSVQKWNHASIQTLDNDSTNFGYVFQGKAMLNSLHGDYSLSKGMYFSVPGPVQLSGNAVGLLIAHSNYKGYFQLGGPVEKKGRLRYIDGCTDSLLISPPVYGDPCLNLLHIPDNTFQTQHTHPSLRAGIIISGHGQCITPDKTYALRSGQSFIIPPEAVHSFSTESSELLVLAYHPDSDFGPSHKNHPMINRTIIESV